MKLALHKYEASLCSCGHSSLLSYGHEGFGEYDGRTVKCHACAEIAREKPNEPGQHRYAIDLHDDPRDDDVEEGADDE